MIDDNDFPEGHDRPPMPDPTATPDLPTDEVAAETTESDSGGDTSFALLVIALLVLVGGSVYFVGRLMSADDATAEAQARAEELIDDSIADFDPNEFSNTTPSSLPLSEDADSGETDDIASADETVAPASTTTTTVIPRPGVDPGTIAIAFVNRVPGDEYGRVGYIDRQGERHITELECDRIDLNANGGICLSATTGFGGSGRGLLLDAGLNAQLKFGVNKPSRAATSADGEVMAWTGFTVGHNYLESGEFATTTQLIEVDRGIGANLETIFRTYRNGEPIVAEDRNYWGVTFVDSDRFYATLGTEGETFIVAGQVSTSRLDVVYENATCPEVSPDGKTIIAKEQRGDRFQLIAIDVASGARRDIGETRSVDDQVEWADDNNIIYALANEAEGTEAQPVFDVWAVNVAPGSQPRLIIPFADSPAETS